MITETLQPNTVGLTVDENYSDKAPGFEHSNVTLVFEQDYHNGYQAHGRYFGNLFQEIDKILELGCGGANLQYWVKQHLPNITYVTLDLNDTTPDSPYITKDTHFTVYTNKPFQIVENESPLKFDYILSFEHLEHIAEETLDVLFQNIKKHCHSGTKVITTASKQIMEPHVSVFPKEKWVEIIERNGFEMLDEIHLTPENCPPNFKFNSTIELVFKLK